MTTGKERKIIVAVNEGEESMYALSWCLKNIVNTRNSKDSLVLLYAKTSRGLYTTPDGDYSISLKRGMQGYRVSSDVLASMEKYSKDMADGIMYRAKRMCHKQFPGIRVVTRVEDGRPKDVICRVAEELGHDALLVMGSQGHGPIRRAFLGSVSTHCAQNVKCPILIVKKPKLTKNVCDLLFRV